MAKLSPVLKGRCPVCHFEEFHLVSCQLGQSEAENARLQERVEEAERCGECASSPEEIRLPAMYRCYYCDKQFCGPHAKTHFTRDEDLEGEHDRFKALAERRKDMLTELAEWHHDQNHVLSFKLCALPICVEARAAIE